MDGTAPETTASTPAARSAPSRLYPRLLGAAWERLHPAVRRVHEDGDLLHADGRIQVSRAPGRLVGLILNAARVPRASDAAQVRLSIACEARMERWCRAFDGRPLVTLQAEGPGGTLAERVGPLEFRFRLAVKGGELVFRQQGLSICLGPWRMPVPHGLAPQIAAREGAAGASTAREDTACGDAAGAGPGDDERAVRTRIDVRVMAPGGGQLFSYRGIVRWGPSPGRP